MAQRGTITRLIVRCLVMTQLMSMTVSAVQPMRAAAAPVSASLVRGGRAAYTYSGTWRGRRVAPLTHVAPVVDVARLRDAAPAGRLANFNTHDPAYTCLNGRAIDVYAAPRHYPDDYAAYTPGQSGGCRTGVWLFPQPAIITTRQTITAQSHAPVRIQGLFPAPRPARAIAAFYVSGTRVATTRIDTWNARAVTLRLPTALPAGPYTLRLSWYDRLTKAYVVSSAVPGRMTAPTLRRRPKPTHTPRPTATPRPTRTPRPTATATATPTAPANGYQVTVPATQTWVDRYHPTKPWRTSDGDRNGSHAACYR